MSYHWSDNVHTTAFTPRDFQVELLAAAREKNIIVCLGHNSSKEFIALKLLHERGHELRKTGENRKISLYICSNGDSTYNLIFHLTDLKVINLNHSNRNEIDWENIVNDYQIIILSANILLDALICSYINLKSVNLLVIEDCHKCNGKEELDDIFRNFYDSIDSVDHRPSILGLAGPLHSAGCPPGRLGIELQHLEKSLACKAETASDIVTTLRYCSEPTEIILECSPPQQCEVTQFLRELINTRKAFLNEHRFDPSEIYSDEFLEELKGIPDPKQEPIELLDQYLKVLDELGPWCADRAAVNLLLRIEKLKVKTPYERHFLLLCMISTTFVQIRAYCDYLFQQLPNEYDRIMKYSSPKVLRVLDILRLFKSSDTAKNKLQQQQEISKCSPAAKAKINEIESMDFKKLAKNVETIQETIIQQNSTVVHNSNNDAALAKDGIEKLLLNDTSTVSDSAIIGRSAGRKQFGNKQQRVPRNRLGGGNAGGWQSNQRTRSYWNNQNDPDALCGLIFCNSKSVAKILCNMFYEMSKNDPDLSYISVQFTVDRTADPITESKEAELEHRKQEEVLKRFRMHECNLLIGTSVLEEGMDLPKCNLVIRWDPPTTYRSYVQCKGRARAPNAYHIIMVAPEIVSPTNGSDCENISDKSHQLICRPGERFISDVNEQKLNAIKEEEIVCETNESNEQNDVDDLDSNMSTTDSSSQSTECDIVEAYNRYSCVVENNMRMCDSGEGVKSESESIVEKEKQQFDEENQQQMEIYTDEIVKRLAQYMEIEKMLLQKCENREPPDAELQSADRLTACIQSYQPLNGIISDRPSVNLSTAVALVNKYCAKLPSDTFTKLTPLWRCGRTVRNGIELFQYTIKLPVNSPIKRDILGLPMPTRILARRIAALITCRILHQSGEIDDNLQPIGKEGFRATEPDWENFELDKNDEDLVYDNLEPRPGTTKRRQYYYKRIASVFSECRPEIGTIAYMYHIKMTLECPIPEEQNTRGRKIYPPEDAPQGFGILTLKKIPKISSFPIFTRSGEVKVDLQLTPDTVCLTEQQLEHINAFLNYTFTNVLRLQKYLMLFDAEAVDNSFFIVPVVRSPVTGAITVDWKFLATISNNSERMPKPISDADRLVQEFDPNRFRDAVVMPWYRNQDQPQYFYVAEICYHLSPESEFPGDNYKTFREYYFRKYDITIQNPKQPLLDVDHTSARLNFLTPRYVNRKGVALPTSSEETKKAKRENLEQKQILVPELCTIHPFPASLWRAAVCLPCILYRINALLLADEIRKQVSSDLGLGKMAIETDEKFQWPMLDFGWSLAEVLKKSRDAKIGQKVNGVGIANGHGEKDMEKTDVNDINGQGEHEKTELENGVNGDEEKSANEILHEANKKMKSQCLMEIGTWSNEMAEHISSDCEENDDYWGLLPPNINMCSTNKGTVRYGSPTWNFGENAVLNNSYYSDSDASYQSDDDCENSLSSNGINGGGDDLLKIQFTSDTVAEAIDTEEGIQKRQRQLEIINDINANEKSYQSTKNIGSGYDCFCQNVSTESIEQQEMRFSSAIQSLENHIRTSGMLIHADQKSLQLTITTKKSKAKNSIAANVNLNDIQQLVPFITEREISDYFAEIGKSTNILALDDLYELHRRYFNENSIEQFSIDGTGDLFDNFNDSDAIQLTHDNGKELTIVSDEYFKDKVVKRVRNDIGSNVSHIAPSTIADNLFSFDRQPNLDNHPGPSPSIILQALTMSNANDGINLERLETIGDSFLKYAITTYLYCTYENVHEGKLSHLRSKQVSNLNLYRLGRRKMFGESMIATKFEPHDNWLPPCYYVPKELEKALIEAKIPACHWNLVDLPNIKELSSEEICKLVKQKAEMLGLVDEEDLEACDKDDAQTSNPPPAIIETIPPPPSSPSPNIDMFPCFIPYNLVTQHSIPDKSVADCVEALIGAYLIECGLRGALLFMAWLGIRVLPLVEVQCDEKSVEKWTPENRITGSTIPYVKNGQTCQIIYGHWAAPKSPLLIHSPNPYKMLDLLLDGYSVFEETIGYKFRDRSYLLQAMTHASYSPNRLTDCYQRLEFLGDAVLDYLITRHLYEDPRQHSPGALTDLRSALVNNTIFASLAVRHGFHKYFRHLSPGLNEVIDRFVRIQHENGHSISEEFYLISEEECDEAEDVEVPKALGDVFESVAGAIFLDSNMSLDTVWKIYSNMMKPEIEQFSDSVPKSPIRELLELEPETAKFSKPEKLADGRRVRVTVEVFGKGTYRGIGRNYRIAKCTAAKCALRQLKKQGLINKRH